MPWGEVVMAFEFMEDCIHLKACRRIQKIGKGNGHSFARKCTEDCSAYVSGGNYYLSASEACDIARAQYDGRSDAYDVYIPHDFRRRTLGEIIDELQEEGG